MAEPGDKYILRACVGTGSRQIVLIKKLEVHIHAVEQQMDLGLSPREYKEDATPSPEESRAGQIQNLLNSMLASG